MNHKILALCGIVLAVGLFMTLGRRSTRLPASSPDVPETSATVPADRFAPEPRHVDWLGIGESCWVSIFSYDVATDGSIWLRRGALCLGSKYSDDSIEVRRNYDGFEAFINTVSRSCRLSADELKGLGHTRVVKIILRPKK